jgi:hypothetical protein
MIHCLCKAPHPSKDFQLFKHLTYIPTWICRAGNLESRANALKDFSKANKYVSNMTHKGKACRPE